MGKNCMYGETRNGERSEIHESAKKEIVPNILDLVKLEAVDEVKAAMEDFGSRLYLKRPGFRSFQIWILASHSLKKSLRIDLLLCRWRPWILP